MKIYTLVGKSGTGKSFHAMELCRKKQIESIIDDGLFIYQNTVVAGISAKRDATKIGAVKTALFQKDEIRDEVAQAIAEKDPKSILILGTSVGMTDECCATVYGYADGEVSTELLESSEDLEIVLADREEVKRILKEEKTALICAYMLMHFLHDEDPFGFLK